MVLLDRFPLWAVYVGTVVIVLIAAETAGGGAVCSHYTELSFGGRIQQCRRETGSFHHLALCSGVRRRLDDYRRSRPASTRTAHRQPDRVNRSVATDDGNWALTPKNQQSPPGCGKGS